MHGGEIPEGARFQKGQDSGGRLPLHGAKLREGCIPAWLKVFLSLGSSKVQSKQSF